MPELFTILEVVATVSGLIHVYLLTKEKIIAWPFGILTVSLYAYIFFVSKLYSDAILHVVYFFLNIYGWYNWSRRKGDEPSLPVTRLPLPAIVLVVFIMLGGSGGWGAFMSTHTDADFPYFDAYTTVTSLVAQYLLAKKKLENWVLWILVDLVAIPIYILKGLLFTAGLYFVYLLLSTSGLISWYRAMRAHEEEEL